MLQKKNVPTPSFPTSPLRQSCLLFRNEEDVQCVLIQGGQGNKQGTFVINKVINKVKQGDAFMGIRYGSAAPRVST